MRGRHPRWRGYLTSQPTVPRDGDGATMSLPPALQTALECSRLRAATSWAPRSFELDEAWGWGSSEAGHGGIRLRWEPRSSLPQESGPFAMTSCTRGSTMVDPPRAGALAKPDCTLQATETAEKQRQVAIHPVNPTMANSPISTQVLCHQGVHCRRIRSWSSARLRASGAPRFPAIEASAR